jgi:hypothetical protein
MPIPLVLLMDRFLVPREVVLRAEAFASPWAVLVWTLVRLTVSLYVFTASLLVTKTVLMEVQAGGYLLQLGFSPHPGLTVRAKVF